MILFDKIMKCSTKGAAQAVTNKIKMYYLYGKIKQAWAVVRKKSPRKKGPREGSGVGLGLGYG